MKFKSKNNRVFHSVKWILICRWKCQQFCSGLNMWSRTHKRYLFSSLYFAVVYHPYQFCFIIIIINILKPRQSDRHLVNDIAYLFFSLHGNDCIFISYWKGTINKKHIGADNGSLQIDNKTSSAWIVAYSTDPYMFADYPVLLSWYSASSLRSSITSFRYYYRDGLPEYKQ